MIDLSLPYITKTPQGFLRIECTSEMMSLAQKRYEVEYKNDIFTMCPSKNTLNPKNKFGNVLGEVVFGFIAPGATFVNCLDYDYIYKNISIEIKTKVRTTPPELRHDSSVPCYQFNRQRNDWYCFMSHLKNTNLIWVCGRISKLNFSKQKYLLKKGEVDKSNGLVAKMDTYNVYCNSLIRW